MGLITAQRTARMGLESDYDKSLREARMRGYEKLWCELEPLAKYSRPLPMKFEELESLTEKLKEWYFRAGGMYMSPATRDAYFALQDALLNLTSASTVPVGISGDEYEALRKLGSTLRTAMAEDLLARKPLMLAASHHP